MGRLSARCRRFQALGRLGDLFGSHAAGRLHCCASSLRELIALVVGERAAGLSLLTVPDSSNLLMGGTLAKHRGQKVGGCE